MTDATVPAAPRASASAPVPPDPIDLLELQRRLTLQLFEALVVADDLIEDQLIAAWTAALPATLEGEL